MTGSTADGGAVIECSPLLVTCTGSYMTGTTTAGFFAGVVVLLSGNSSVGLVSYLSVSIFI
jgi:hypothetical protein